ncbi:hypothetical protein AVEN_20397-1 [Araneus ventricosus]|uniref:Uncharacterized protein n=1 Tax=Araneus ventricosus TaxID=182803 RepID=A0A4Y2PZU0_ARAVE|nr:hypothetical protein AVEN_20397-1 [Araneus ventricosus]
MFLLPSIERPSRLVELDCIHAGVSLPMISSLESLSSLIQVLECPYAVAFSGFPVIQRSGCSDSMSSDPLSVLTASFSDSFICRRSLSKSSFSLSISFFNSPKPTFRDRLRSPFVPCMANHGCSNYVFLSPPSSVELLST